MKKALAFDLDDTLAVTKSPISDRMSETLAKVLDEFDVCIISGGAFSQFKKQVIDQLDISPMQLRRLHLMPTCGTRYYRYNETSRAWDLQYAEDLSSQQKGDIVEALEKSAKQLNLWTERPTGDIIEDRESQITYSALGQQATPADKYAWDPDGSKKMALRDLVALSLPDLEVRVGGTTSIDVTRVGIDKAYGIYKLTEVLGVTKDEILFFGDKLQEGGNDYPVKAMGIDCIEVGGWEDTVDKLEVILTTT